MRFIEKVYADLSYKAQWEPMNDKEFYLFEIIQNKLGIQSCDSCKGQGGITIAGMMGGWEFCPCKKCGGLGELNHSEELQHKLIEESHLA